MIQTSSNEAPEVISDATQELLLYLGTNQVVMLHKCYDLFKRGVELRASNSDKKPLLYMVALRQLDDILHAMLEAGVDPHEELDGDGNNALHAVVIGRETNGIAPILRLLNAGLSPHDENYKGKTVRDVVLNKKSPLKIEEFDALVWLHQNIKAGTVDARAWYDYLEQHVASSGAILTIFVRSFPFMLEALRDQGDAFPKEWLFEHGKAELLKDSFLSNYNTAIPLFQTVCAQQGEPMTYADWQKSGLLEKINAHGVNYTLFSPDFWGAQPDLAPMLELYERLDVAAKERMESVSTLGIMPVDLAVGPTVTNGHALMAKSFSAWCSPPEHTQSFKASDVRNFLKAMPAEVRDRFAGGHTLMANAQRRTFVAQQGCSL